MIARMEGEGKRKSAIGNRQWAVGSGQSAMGNGQWAVGNGQWAMLFVIAVCRLPFADSRLPSPQYSNFLSCGALNQVMNTTATVMQPPNTTEGTTPMAFAITPLSNWPSSVL
jgi:hypothetical protein